MNTGEYNVDAEMEKTKGNKETAVIEYSLEIQYTPLSWNELSIAFALNDSVYIVIFCLVGLISLVVMLFFWFY